ncbi:MAG TPA: DOMON-like domain-containing protein [Novosphingobium sp.]|nr:DOMON-like domain-containing protein [Novosphingobium sp.]
MGTHHLIAHPDHPPLSARGIDVQFVSTAGELRLRYRIDGRDALVLPEFAGFGRADELWRTTCFELYLQGGDTTGYVEFNFSPSRRWAAYEFDDYREGMRNLPIGHEPTCEITEGERFLVLDVRLPALGLPPQPWTVGLSAILEEDFDTKSYWALAHAPGKPDFHHPTCFALELPATRAK